MTTMIYLSVDDNRWHIDVVLDGFPQPIAVFLCDSEEEAIAYEDEAVRITRQRVAAQASA